MNQAPELQANHVIAPVAHPCFAMRPLNTKCKYDQSRRLFSSVYFHSHYFFAGILANCTSIVLHVISKRQRPQFVKFYINIYIVTIL